VSIDNAKRKGSLDGTAVAPEDSVHRDPERPPPRKRPEGAGRTAATEATMIRKLKSGKYRLYSRKRDPKTGRARNLGTFDTRKAAEAHERAVQFFKRRG
jgi:hypothetical protein